jgi:hypothetical protein|tara:strand:+ start:40 stop:612 length:573 start_codon:yes stop_codon:yes gene_type:complete
MAEQSNIKNKWKDMVDHVTKPRKELDGMAICPFAKMGFNRNEVVVHWVGKDMFKIANQTLEDYPLGKQLVLCIGDPKDYSLQELEQWENDNQMKAVSNDLYIYTSYKSEEKQGSVGVEKNSDKLIPGLGSGNKGLAIIQIQGLADLNEKSEWVHRNTKYYDKWNKKYYDAIVKRRYKDSNYDSEEFENNG